MEGMRKTAKYSSQDWRAPDRDSYRGFFEYEIEMLTARQRHWLMNEENLYIVYYII
jgi:hypothetical protein